MADERRGSRALAVLAVALALMALVTALSSGGGHTNPVALHRSVEGTGPTTLPRGRSHSSGRGNTAGTHAPRARGVLERSSLGSVHAVRAVKDNARALADSANADVASTANAQPPAAPGSGTRRPGSSLEPAGSASPAAEPDLPAGSPRPKSTAGSGGSGSTSITTPSAYPGRASIDPPSTSASFAAAGGGAVSARAAWTGTPSLELEISCPGGVSATRTGSSGLSLELDDAYGGGDCTVTVSLPPGVQADVSFTLVINPAP
jgi:hypothetical protein